MKLSNRLEAVLSLVNQWESAADIGTDHGYVPLELVRRGTVERALAMDVRKGPLGKAKENIKNAGLSQKIETRLSDGLEKLMPGEAHAVIIAGMGGLLMIHILEAGRHMWQSVDQWVLSPQSDIPEVRKFLAENGFLVIRERMIFEDGKYYTILDVGKQEIGTESQMPLENVENQEELNKEFIYGQYLKTVQDPVFLDYLKDEEEKFLSLMENLRERAEFSPRVRESLEEIEKKLAYNREVQHEMQRGR